MLTLKHACYFKLGLNPMLGVSFLGFRQVN